MFLESYEEFFDHYRSMKTRFQLRRIPSEDFYDDFSRKIRFLLKASAYVLGEGDASKERSESTCEAYDFIQTECEDDILPFHLALIKLWDTQNEWESIQDFRILLPPTLGFLNLLGVFPTETDSREVYLSIQ